VFATSKKTISRWLIANHQYRHEVWDCGVAVKREVDGAEAAGAGRSRNREASIRMRQSRYAEALSFGSTVFSSGTARA